VLASALQVAPAGALFHFVVIDEVMTSHGGDPNVQFIEMRMLTSSQNFVANSVFAAFDASGSYIGDILVVPGNVANSGTGVRWIVGTTQFQTASGLAPDFIMPAGILPTSGGMVCYGGGGGISPAPPGSWSRTNFANYADCVAYGTYSGPSNPLIGTPTSLNGDGHSLQRINISNNNAADFTCGDPATPQRNSGTSASMPATSPCVLPPTSTPTITPTPTPTSTTGPTVCPAAPDGTCNVFPKGLFAAKEFPAGKQKLLAKFINGPALAQTDLGNPLGMGGTAYTLCVYDDGGAKVGELTVDRAGDTCGSGDPCWAAVGGAPPSGKGYKYKDDDLAALGAFKILYKGGAADKSKALFKGKGAALPDGIAAALQTSTSVTVQLRGDDAPECLSITVSDIKKQESNFFKAK
jgi:hypothetical protein